MLLPLFVTLLPVVFLAGLVQRAVALRRRDVDMGGVPPIPKTPFVSRKWAIAAGPRQEYRDYCGRVRRYL